MLPRQRPRVSKRCLATSSARALASASAKAASPPAVTPAESAAALVRSRDHPAHLASFFYPHHLVPHYLALRAFNVETAAVKDNVSSEILGRIRVGWWRDAIRGAFDNKPAKHPVVLALRDAIHDPAVQAGGGLVEDHFMRIIDAREADIAAPAVPPTLEDLESYAEGTSSRLLYLSLNLVSLSTPELDEIFSHLGKASGIVTQLASLPHSAGFTARPAGEAPSAAPARPAVSATRRLTLPREYVAKHGVVEEEVFRAGPTAKGLNDAIFDTATRANDYLISARVAISKLPGGKVPPLALGPLMNAVHARNYLERLEAAQFDVFDPALQQQASGKGWRLPWSMWKTKRRANI